MVSGFKTNRSGQARVLTPDQLVELIENLQQPHRLIVQLCYYTAARIEEVTLLRGEDIDLAGRTLIYRASNTKTGESRSAAIPDPLYAALVEYGIPKKGWLFPSAKASGKERAIRRTMPDGTVKETKKPPRETISPQAVDKAVRQAFGLMGITGASLHSFRRSMATHLQDEGLTLADIASITGHKDLASLTHYLEPKRDRAIEALQRVSSRLGG